MVSDPMFGNLKVMAVSLWLYKCILLLSKLPKKFKIFAKGNALVPCKYPSPINFSPYFSTSNDHMKQLFHIGLKKNQWLLSFISFPPPKKISWKEKRGKKEKRGENETEHEKDFLSQYLILQIRTLMIRNVRWLSWSHKGLATGPLNFHSVIFHVLLLTSPWHF